MMTEDLSIFFDHAGFAVACSAGGHSFSGILSEPSRNESFDQSDVMVQDRVLVAPTADISLANLVQGSTVTVAGQLYPVRHPPRRSGCGLISTLYLGTPQ